jgi:hypothetical protein
MLLDQPHSIEMLQQFASQLEHTEPALCAKLRAQISGEQPPQFYYGFIAGLGVAYGTIRPESAAMVGALIAITSRDLLNRMKNDSSGEMGAG